MFSTLQLFNSVRQLPTILDMLRWGVSCFEDAELFFGHGTDNAWDEAAAIVNHVLNLPSDFDKPALSARLLLSERMAIAKLYHERVQTRKPLAYLTQRAWFADLEFYVDERVLIPRSPMAELVIQQFQPWIDFPSLQVDHAPRVLDLCTGSGCIAIATALYVPDAIVDAVDVSEHALAVAQKNIDKYACDHAVHLIQSDLFSELLGQKYDVIVSNPPYVDALEMGRMPAEYRHEPALGLAAGLDGLDVVRKILHQAADFLNPHGVLIVEVGASAPTLEKTYPGVPFTWVEFERGGDGVFVLTYEQLKLHAAEFAMQAEKVHLPL